MERLSCPATIDNSSLTLKSRAMAFVEADMRGAPEQLHPTDDLSLEELKCEADSMIALTTFLITRGLGQSESHQHVLAERLRRNTPEGGNVLETLLQGKDDFIKAVLINNFRELRDSGDSSDLLGRLEHYRQAYYERSPQADGIEGHYASTENMLLTGTSTATDRFALLLHSFNTATKQTSLDRQQKIKLARGSEHLPILLAKISVADESRFVDLLNNHEFLSVALVRVDEGEDGPRAIFDQRIIARMRQVYPDQKPQYAHRGHLGCPASVSFDGHSNAISELWHLTVGALERYGFWDDSDSEALSGFITDPDAK